LAQSHLDVDATLKAEQERLTSRKQELQTEIQGIDQRLRRIAAYFGGASAQSQITRPPQGSRLPRGFVQGAVLKTITGHPEGMTSGEITKALGGQGIGQQSIANALSALIQSEKISSEGRRGKYRSVAEAVPLETPKEEAPEGG
jgi:hypothetical protein